MRNTPSATLCKFSPVLASASPEARYRLYKTEWSGLLSQACYMDAQDAQRSLPQASNTFSSSLVTQFLLDGAVTVLQHKWAALKCFAREFSTDRYKPRASGELKTVASADTAVQTNATNFESGDSTVNNTQIDVSQYTSAFHVTNDELNSGLRLSDLIEVQLAHLADKIISVVTTPITAGNFTATPILSAPTSFGWSDMGTAWGQLKKSPIHNAVLDGEYLARVINVPSQFQKTGDAADPGAWGAFGWDNLALNTNWTAAGTNVRGFFCNPTAIGCIAGLPLTPAEPFAGNLQQNVITIPGPEISIAAYLWFSLSSRTAWASYDLMFGASKVDGTAGLLLTSA